MDDWNGPSQALSDISNRNTGGVDNVQSVADSKWSQARPDNEAGPNRESGWFSEARRYEWNEAYGDVGPRDEELEKDLFFDEHRVRRGIQFDTLVSIKVTAEAIERPAPINDFRAAGLHPIMVENIALCGYDVPTPIQAYTIPAVLKGRDVIATAQTGSGKTAAFLAPSISKLLGKARKLCAPRPALGNFNPATDKMRAEPLILVLAPTRELCCQIFDEARRLCYRSMLRPCVVYGGGPIRQQKDELRKGCDVLIATTGRLADLMKDPGLLALSRLRFTILDEADELLQDDWADDLSKILSGGDANEDAQHQYLLFSATFNKKMRRVARNFLSQDHVRIRIGRAGATHVNVKQEIVYVNKELKKQALYDLLMNTPPARTLVFVRSKMTADFVDDFLFNHGLPSTSIHANRTQIEREDALRAFKNGTAPILVATGVSARGIDIKNVMHVINFDLPSIEHNGEDEYIHRIGRTARIGNQGMATSFYNDNDEALAPFLCKILMENRQPVPDFLEQFKPADGEAIDFHDDSADEDDEGVDGEAGLSHSGMTNSAPADEDWGNTAAPIAAGASGDAWGTTTFAANNDSGW